MAKNKKTTIKWANDQTELHNTTHSKTSKCKPKNCPRPSKLISASIVLFACSLFFVVAIFFTNNPTKTSKRAPEIIANQIDFDTLKDTILQNKKLTAAVQNEITDNTHTSNNITYIDNKYIAIIKENKVFLINAKTDSFITSIDISPTPNNNIYYYNIFAINDNIIITGYKKDTQELEITKLHINKNLSLNREDIYRISSLPQNHDTLFTDNNLVFYTTHEITPEITAKQLSSIDIWSSKKNEFVTQNIPHQTTLYDKILSPIDPIVHTVTICPFNESRIDTQTCTQKQIIDNRDAMLTLGNKNILLTTTNIPPEHSLISTPAYTKKYHIPTTDKVVYITTAQQNEHLPSLSPQNILLSQQVTDNQKITIYKENDKLFANIVSSNKIIDTPFQTNIYDIISDKYTVKTLPLNQDLNLKTDKSHINIFNFDDNIFISIALNNPQNNAGRLDLFRIDDNSISNVHSLPITHYDAKIPNQFFANTITNKLYALTNNYLKQFTYDADKIILAKTVNYTQKPVYKPKLKLADFPVGAKKVNGKYVCKKKRKEYVGKSKKNNKGYYHLDRECCLDPDEYPNPWCTYRPGELNRTKLKYKDYTGKKVKR